MPGKFPSLADPAGWNKPVVWWRISGLSFEASYTGAIMPTSASSFIHLTIWLPLHSVWVHPMLTSMHRGSLPMSFCLYVKAELGIRWHQMIYTAPGRERSNPGTLAFVPSIISLFFFFLFAVSFLSSQHVRVSIAPWGERNWEGCSLIIFQWNHHTWDDMIQSTFTSRSIHHVSELLGQ